MLLNYSVKKAGAIILIIFLGFVIVGFSRYKNEPVSPKLVRNNKPNIFINGCNQSETTTDCAELTRLAEESPTEPISTDLENLEWRKYKNDELGFSFLYPTKSTLPLNDAIGNGISGKAFQVTVRLPSGSTIYGYAFSKDYTVEKDGVLVGTEGYVYTGGKYSIITRGQVSNTAFVPDDIIHLKNGSDAVIIYGKNADPSADYQEPPMSAMVNLNGKTFTGIGFVLYSSKITSEDMAYFKAIVSSIETN